MSIFIKCHICRRQHTTKKKLCPCGQDLDKAKKNKKIDYYIEYRLPNGKKKREKVGKSQKEAVACEGKRKGEKAENRILDIKPGVNVTFNELYIWFKDIPQLKKLKSMDVLLINLNSFLKVYGNYAIYSLTKHDLENYQIDRKDQGLSDSYIDQEIGAARNMVNRAWEADKVSGDALRPFKQLKKLLVKGENKRDVYYGFDDVMNIISHMPIHAKRITLTAFYSGMRRGEILPLAWDRVDMKARTITLEKEHTKTKKARLVPICDELHAILENIPRQMVEKEGQEDKEDKEMEISPFVFIYRKRPVKSIRASLRKACEKAGIPYGRNVENGLTFHDLRHIFKTNMRRAGVHDLVIMGVMGHTTREMSDRYDTVEGFEMVDGVQAMTRALNQDQDKKAKK